MNIDAVENLSPSLIKKLRYLEWLFLAVHLMLAIADGDIQLPLYFAIYSVAIALTEKLQPDVILMDIQMPICDGVTATAKIHESYPWIKILMLTTFADEEYIGQSLQAGAKGYLLKRKSPEEMAMAIRAVN
ncbi:MAG: response regulator transcription factor [Cyanobacteria bacterium P01_A01_bin.40]